MHDASFSTFCFESCLLISDLEDCLINLGRPLPPEVTLVLEICLSKPGDTIASVGSSKSGSYSSSANSSNSKEIVHVVYLYGNSCNVAGS